MPGGGIADAGIADIRPAWTRLATTARAGQVKTVPPQLRDHVPEPAINGDVTTQ
jgi:hypothetical protein